MLPSFSSLRTLSYIKSSFFSLVLLSVPLFSSTCAQNLDVPYVPTPQPVVDRMLKAAHVEPGDYVIDLGSGDGRIVISAARLGATGHGVDIDPQRIKEARENAQSQGVDNKVMFLQKDLFETDISQASVITMYLLTSVNRKLRPRLFEMLRPGTRVVSHSFDMGDWDADATYTVESSMGRNHTVYLWVMPADAAGEWSWSVEGKPFTLDVDQQYQELDVELESDGRSLAPEKVVLRGRRLSFAVQDGNDRYLFSGRIEGDALSGTVQLRSEDDRILNWSADRN